MSDINITPLDNKENPVNKDICNGFGCINQGTEQIVVSAGKYGTIPLKVCQFCISKFQTKGDTRIGK